jgi:RNA recognition motif-containing protein
MTSPVAIVVVIALVTFVAGICVGSLISRRSKGKPKTKRKLSEGGGNNRTESAVELYVGNLPYATTEKELSSAFQGFGRVLSVRLIENRHDGRPKGFGFVEMDSSRTAGAAIKAMHGKGFKGRALVVNEARSRVRDN